MADNKPLKSMRYRWYQGVGYAIIEIMSYSTSQTIRMLSVREFDYTFNYPWLTHPSIFAEKVLDV